MADKTKDKVIANRSTHGLFKRSGDLDYTVAWILLTFLGLFGIHRFYMGKWITGIVYLLSGGIFGIGYLYDLWTLNEQVLVINSR